MTASPRYSALVGACRLAPPQLAIVLGSGLGELAQRLQPIQSVPFAEIPGLPATSIHGHKGVVTLGTWVGQRVLLFEGRLHYYEGHPWEVVTRPLRRRRAGARVALLTNAAGGIAEPLGPGTLMAIRDQIEWNRPNWWRHAGPGGLGGARSSPYSPRLLGLLQDSAQAHGVTLHQGVYLAVTGPSYETPAEIRAMRAYGADAVGMSTAREILAANDAGMECAAISCITNRAAGLHEGPLNHQDVLETAKTLTTQLTRLIEGFLAKASGAA